jgi:hypothetical protein
MLAPPPAEVARVSAGTNNAGRHQRHSAHHRGDDAGQGANVCRIGFHTGHPARQSSPAAHGDGWMSGWAAGDPSSSSRRSRDGLNAAQVRISMRSSRNLERSLRDVRARHRGVRRKRPNAGAVERSHGGPRRHRGHRCQGLQPDQEGRHARYVPRCAGCVPVTTTSRLTALVGHGRSRADRCSVASGLAAIARCRRAPLAATRAHGQAIRLDRHGCPVPRARARSKRDRLGRSR